MNLIKIIESEYQKLGGGANGKVFVKDNIANKITRNKNEYEIAKTLVNYELKSFPKFYFAGILNDNFLIKRDVVKLLKPNTIVRINHEKKYIDKYFFYKDKSSKTNLLKHFDESFILFFDQLRDDVFKIENINKNVDINQIDIHGENIGLNKNNDFVLFDF